MNVQTQYHSDYDDNDLVTLTFADGSSQTLTAEEATKLAKNILARYGS